MSGFRADVEGLRAIAVLAVFAFHAGFSWAAGGYVGVDVFFAISGFVITGSLLRERDKTGRISLREFYARRFRRLVPAASVTLLAVLAFTRFSPWEIALDSVAADARAATLFVANLRFAHQARDYMAMNEAPSPLLHFWTLSVEEQYYAVWPALLALSFAVARRSGRAWRPAAGIAIGFTGLVSLACSLALTPHFPIASFYGLHTRLWEIAAGGALAVLGGETAGKISGNGGRVLAGAGLFSIGLAIVLFDVETGTPGVAALLPVAGTVAVIAGGMPLLGTQPLRWLGSRSYGWYLWHWPVLLASSDGRAGATAGVGTTHVLIAGAISLALSELSYRLVERPIRHSTTLTARPRLTIGLAACAIAGTCAMATLVPHTRTEDAGSLRAQLDEARSQGFGAVGGCFSDREPQTALPEPCAFGDRDAERSIALIGDSHAAMWMLALGEMGAANGYRVRAWAKSACPWIGVPSYEACDAWRSLAFAKLREEGPFDAVVVVHSQSLGVPGAEGPDELERAARDGAATSLRALAAATSRVIVLRGTPAPPGNISLCVSTHVRDPAACAFRLSEAMEREARFERGESAAAREITTPRTVSIRTDELVCDVASDTCPAVDAAGNVIWFNSNHLTPRAAAAVQPRLSEALLRALRD